MTRKEQRNRMPAINVNDGKMRVVITIKEDGSGIESVGRYGLNPVMALSALIDALPVIRNDETKYIDERWQMMTAKLEEEKGDDYGIQADATPDIPSQA